MLKKTCRFSLALLLLIFQIPAIPSAQEEKITVYNPRGIQHPIRLIPMPERGAIEGKTVYLGFRASDFEFPAFPGWADEMISFYNNYM